MRGHSKLYHVLQQLTANLYLAMLIISLILPNGNLGLRLNPIFPSINDPIGLNNSIQFNSLFPQIQQRQWDDKVVVLLFGNICFHQNYFFSLLQSLNYYNMIYKPLQFDKYSKNRNVIRRVITCLVISITLSIPQIIREVKSSFALSKLTDSALKLLVETARFHQIYNVVMICLLKIGHTVMLSVISFRVQRALAESRAIRNDKSCISPLFLAVCLVPLFNNILYLGSDIPRILDCYWQIQLYPYYRDFDHMKNWRWLQIKSVLSISVYLVASVVQCLAYLACFPHLKQGLCNGFAKLKCRCFAPDHQID